MTTGSNQLKFTGFYISIQTVEIIILKFLDVKKKKKFIQKISSESLM